MRRKLSTSEIKKRLRAGAYHDGTRPLSAKRVQRLKGAGRYHDGLVRGLYLQVSPTGARSWLLRYEVLGKERMMGLGSAQEFSLAQARERALEARRLLADGKDPLRAKREAKAASKEAAGRRRTFREAAQEYYQQHLPSWRSIAHAKQWMRSLEVYAFPIIGSMDVADIITADVLRVVQPHWQTRTVTADRIRNRVESVIALAAVSGYRPKGPNPAAWQDHLNNVLPAVKKVAEVQHHPALADAELPAFMQELRRKEGTAARALEFTILTAARAGETLGARWDEYRPRHQNLDHPARTDETRARACSTARGTGRRAAAESSTRRRQPLCLHRRQEGRWPERNGVLQAARAHGTAPISRRTA